MVAEDDVLVEVMTEKAAVEVPSPVSGRVVSTTGGPGDMVPVGAELIVLDTQGGAGEAAAAKPVAATAEQANNLRSAPTQAAAASRKAGVVAAAAPGNGAGLTHSTAARSGRVATSPAIRRRAHEAGIDLTQVSGSGPKGRIVRQDLDAYVARRSQLQPVQLKPADKPAAARPRSARGGTEEIKVIGLRRLIAQRMSDSKRNIPHFAYVEEIDATELEALRRHLNGKLEPGAAALTYLPFLVLGLVRVLEAFPQCNALYDAERAVIVRHASVHVGVATQTAEGLKVPVVRDAQSRSLWDLAAEMRRVTEAAHALTAWPE